MSQRLARALLPKHRHLSDRLRTVTIGMYYEVLEGKEQVFEKAFASVLGAIQEAEEHRI